MDVLDMAPKVVVIADHVVPIAPLPDTTLAPRVSAVGFVSRDASRKPGLDLRPAARIVGIVQRQSPKAMQVVRKHDDREDFEWTNRARIAKRSAKVIDAINE